MKPVSPVKYIDVYIRELFSNLQVYNRIPPSKYMFLFTEVHWQQLI